MLVFPISLQVTSNTFIFCHICFNSKRPRGPTVSITAQLFRLLGYYAEFRDYLSVRRFQRNLSLLITQKEELSSTGAEVYDLASNIAIPPTSESNLSTVLIGPTRN
jgi:hypothetical protein